MDMLYRMMDEHILTVVKYAPIALQNRMTMKPVQI